MTQLDSYGFEDLRTYIQNNWAFIAVIDDASNEALRWDVAANANASWSSGPGSNPLTAELTVTGQDVIDAGGSLPITLTGTESYKSSSATTRTTHDPWSDATLEVAEDEVVISHNFRLPP
ncbi:hypothetical protein [Halorientalis persicus]|uniref:hypothetical protein n=1 Tax=Halorientalis persicus TaxID=1367881 RepID=UPI001114395A|nr:hypothetical protein [Halorientalis persicus]